MGGIGSKHKNMYERLGTKEVERRVYPNKNRGEKRSRKDGARQRETKGRKVGTPKCENAVCCVCARVCVARPFRFC